MKLRSNGKVPRIYKAVVNWTGFTGGPGYSVFHAATFSEPWVGGAQALADALRLFFDGIKVYLPSAVRINVDPEVQVIEDSTGVLVDVATVVAPAVVAGTAAGGYSAPSGVVVNWSTATIRNGRRMRGRTFLVPMGSTTFDPDGTVNGAALSTMNTAVDNLLATAGIDLLVYGRPTPLNADGVSGVITAGQIPDRFAILRSRRD